MVRVLMPELQVAAEAGMLIIRMVQMIMATAITREKSLLDFIINLFLHFLFF